MTRYRVPVADPLLAERDAWLPGEGFRLVSVDGPWLAHPEITICTFEDDKAGPEFQGKLVEPVISAEYETYPDLPTRQRVKRQWISDRQIVAG